MSARVRELVRSYWERPDGEALHPDVEVHGFQPLRRLTGATELITRLWTPLRVAIPDILRRPYILIHNRFEGDEWLATTGDFIGTFAADWRVGEHIIPTSRQSVHFRYGEFYRVAEGRIVEIRMLVDLPELLTQVGIDLLTTSTGRELWIPGPRTGDGVLQSEQPADESARSLRLVESMIFEGLNRYDRSSQESQGLERFWHPAMRWYGPRGIGSAFGLDEFKANAQGPILRAFPDRKGVGHRARIAEGRYAASTGWPSLVGTHTADFLGWPPTGTTSRWNIMDFWRREGALLVENWVLVDLIDVALQAGIDLLAPLAIKQR